nr:hypothetical protein [Tanacetum cinerariifolium]
MLELQSITHKLIEKLSQEKVSQEEALEKFNLMVERDDEIKVLEEINVELDSVTHKLIEKLSQKKVSQEEALEKFNLMVERDDEFKPEKDSQEEAIEEFNSTPDNVLEKLKHEKDSPCDFYVYMYDTDDDASISGKSSGHFGCNCLRMIHQFMKRSLKRLWKWLMIKLKHNLIKKWLMIIWMMNRLKKENQARGLESPKKRWSRMKSQRNAYKDPLVSLMATKDNLGEVVTTCERGLGFKPRRGGFPSGAKKEWGLSPKAKVRVLHTAQLDVTGIDLIFPMEVKGDRVQFWDMILQLDLINTGCDSFASHDDNASSPNSSKTPKAVIHHEFIDTPGRSVYWVPKVFASVLPVLGTVYDSLDECIV